MDDRRTASDVTRRRLLQTAAVGAASATALGAAGAADARTGESPDEILSKLATAESFGVTFLTEAVRRAPGTPSADLVDTLRAANTAEYDHVVALRKLGGRQITLKFWIPEAAFGDGGVGLFESIETADTLELMGYLTGVTAFANRGHQRAARFLAEGCAIESEHRAIARLPRRLWAAAGRSPSIAASRTVAMSSHPSRGWTRMICFRPSSASRCHS